MKYFFIFIAASVVSCFELQKFAPYCCRYASSIEDCHDSCLEILKTKNEVYLEKLYKHFPTNCPRSSPKLIKFWDCIGAPNETSQGWIGRECCEYAVADQCRSACLQSNSTQDLTRQCRSNHEEPMHSCIFKQESKQKCCVRRNGVDINNCKHLCEMSFGFEKGPSEEHVENIAKSCDGTMAICMSNFTKAVRVSSSQSKRCCNEATDETCKQSCKHILDTEMTNIVEGLIKACGHIIPHEPMWKCFLHRTGLEPSSSRGTWEPKLQCCSRSSSYYCKQLCKKVYGNLWPDSNTLAQFEQRCWFNTIEMEMRQCLDEVSEPCRIGCSDLTYCTNFNDRPTSLFRNCNVDGDKMARDHFKAWSGGNINLPSVSIPVKNIQQCQPNKWKAVACALQIKPCSSPLSESLICKVDCLSLLDECLDKTRFSSSQTVEDLCENFSPAHLQNGCISLSIYSKPSRSHVKEGSEVNQPCHPNPCPNGKLCVVDRSECSERENCPGFTCLPGCKMGYGSKFIVSEGSLVRVTDTLRGEGCFKLCQCSADGVLRPCTDLPCTDKKKSCELEGLIRNHGEKFKQDCNFCSCYSGNITCTTRQCLSLVTKDDQYTNTPDKCPVSYQPVCGSDGRTYPNRYVAMRRSQENNSLSEGSCLSKLPCNPNPCKHNERCMPTPRVCVSTVEQCFQYECVPKYRHCSRLLKTAAPLLKTIKRNSRRFAKYKNILSSSRFFSNSALLSSSNAVCDAENEQFDDICKLSHSKQRKDLGHLGRCKTNCHIHHAQPVCGQDGVTYNHSCMADANNILVDYMGRCRNFPADKDADCKENVCADVSCPSLTNSKCYKIRPPGACCFICGGMLRVVINLAHLDAIPQIWWNGPITVHDIILLLRHQLHVLECNIYGYLTTEGDMAIVVVTTVTKPSSTQDKACYVEAERLSRLINNRSPTFTSYLILSPLTSATIYPSNADSGSRKITFSIIILMFMHSFIWIYVR